MKDKTLYQEKKSIDGIIVGDFMRKEEQNEEQNKEKKMGNLSKKWLYIIGIVFILGIEFLIRDIFLPENAQNIHIGISVLIEFLILLILLLFWIPKVENHNLKSIGFGKFKKNYIWKGILTYFILLVVFTGSSFALKAFGLEGLRSLQPKLQDYSIPILISLFLAGTFIEEIFYRGYLIERLTLLTKKSWLAGLISWIAFTLVHFKFFGLGPTLEVGILSAALVILYLKERNIWPCIIVHGINDAFGFLIFPLLGLA